MYFMIQQISDKYQQDGKDCYVLLNPLKLSNPAIIMLLDLVAQLKLNALGICVGAALLATYGMLVKRPLLVGNGFVLTGFKEEEWAAKLK